MIPKIKKPKSYRTRGLPDHTEYGGTGSSRSFRAYRTRIPFGASLWSLATTSSACQFDLLAKLVVSPWNWKKHTSRSASSDTGRNGGCKPAFFTRTPKLPAHI